MCSVPKWELCNVQFAMWWLPSDGSHKDKEDLLIKQSALLGVALGCGNGPAGDQGYKSISAVLSLFLMPLLPLSFLSLLFVLLTWMPRCLTAEKTLSHVPAGLQMAEDWLWWDFQFFIRVKNSTIPISCLFPSLLFIWSSYFIFRGVTGGSCTSAIRMVQFLTGNHQIDVIQNLEYPFSCCYAILFHWHIQPS